MASHLDIKFEWHASALDINVSQIPHRLVHQCLQQQEVGHKLASH